MEIIVLVLVLIPKLLYGICPIMNQQINMIHIVILTHLIIFYEQNLINMKIILASSVFLRNLNGHTDAIWSMSLADNILASVSADSTIRIWNPFSIEELSETGFCLNILNENKSNFLFESKL